jgi:hypothetical protein
MVASGTSLKVTLDATTVLFQAEMTVQICPSTWHFASNSCDVVIGKPNLRGPVNTDNVSPSCFITGHGLYNAFYLGTHGALNICAGHVFVFD